MSGFSLVLIVVVFDNYYLHLLFYYFAKKVIFPFLFHLLAKVFTRKEFPPLLSICYPKVRASQVVLVVKSPPANAGDIRDIGSISGLGRSPGGGHGNPLYYSCLGIPWTEDPGGLQSVLRVSKSQI